MTQPFNQLGQPMPQQNYAAPQPAVNPAMPMPQSQPMQQQSMGTIPPQPQQNYAPQPAAVPAPAMAQQPTPQYVAPQAQVPQGMSGNPMNTMDQLRKQIAEAQISDQQRGMPLGTAIYVVNNISYKLTPTNNIPLDEVALTCAVPLADANGLKLGESGYSGSTPGATYTHAIFRQSKFGSHVKQWMELVRCFSGMTAEEFKQYQSTEQGVSYLYQLLSMYMGYDFQRNQPTHSVLANMNMVEIATVSSIVDDKTNGVINYDQNGQPKKKTYVNSYFNRHVLLAEVWPLFAGKEDLLYRYFGGQENFLRAWAAQNPQTT